MRAHTKNQRGVVDDVDRHRRQHASSRRCLVKVNVRIDGMDYTALHVDNGMYSDGTDSVVFGRPHVRRT